MTLTDLIDLEAQLARDREADPIVLEARDRALVPDGMPRERRGTLLARWLEALREREPGRLQPGRTIKNVLLALRATLALAGFLVGWGAATAVFRYTGEHPVNIWNFLLLFVWLQIFLFVLLIGSLLLPLATLREPILGPLREVLAWILRRLPMIARWMHWGTSGERAVEWQSLWHRLRSRRSLYHTIEPWILLGLTQVFGVAFNVGALFACLRLFVFSDIAFSWSTTLLALNVQRFHALVEAIAAPWRVLWPDAVPSDSLVAATRYSRLESAYVLSGTDRSADPMVVGGWWPFVVAALITYGLMPRVMALALAQFQTARLLARLPLDDAEVSRVVRRLTERHVDARAMMPEPDSIAIPTTLAPRTLEPVDGQGSCAVVLWRDVPAGPAVEAAVSQQTRRPVGPVFPAGGISQEGAMDWGRALEKADPVVVVAEAFEAPDRAATRLLRHLRRLLGPRRNMIVLLVAPAPSGLGPPSQLELRIWQQGVARLEDPYLTVDGLRKTP